jgi:hypothetical protein
LCQLIANFNACVDPDYDFEQFYNEIWNLDTAIGYGLQVWGRIVGVGNVLTITEGDYLGMTGPAGASGDSFDNGIFYSGEPTTGNFVLSDSAFYQLILAKAAANITNGSTQAINEILINILFPNRGNANVIDNQNMTMTYNFSFPLLPYEIALVNKFATFISPCGVSFNLVQP